MRAVLDANVIVSAVLSRTGAPARVVKRWLLGEFELVVSPLLLEEVERALAYPKVLARVDADAAARILMVLDEAAEHADDPPALPSVVSRDPHDNYLIALAASARATLVTGDAHLLELEGSIPVVSPGEFLDRLG